MLVRFALRAEANAHFKEQKFVNYIGVSAGTYYSIVLSSERKSDAKNLG